MTYSEEQKIIESLIINLSCMLHHNRTLHFMRKTLTEVSPQFVENSTFTLGLLEGTVANAKSEINTLLTVMGKIMSSDGLIRGSEYHESLPDRIKPLPLPSKMCSNCERFFTYTSSKQKFCSSACRIKNHRKKQEPRRNQF